MSHNKLQLSKYNLSNKEHLLLNVLSEIIGSPHLGRIPKQRMKWTTAPTETIMPIFYRIVNLGLETVGFRQSQPVKFCTENLHIQVWEQRDADQFRVSWGKQMEPWTKLFQERSNIKRPVVIWISKTTTTTLKNMYRNIYVTCHTFILQAQKRITTSFVINWQQKYLELYCNWLGNIHLADHRYQM